MELNVYQIHARETAVYPNLGNNLYYPVLGLCGEQSEVADNVLGCNGYIYKNKLYQSKIKEISKELGDVLWYIANTAIECSLKLSEIVGLTLFEEVQDTIAFDYASLYDTLMWSCLRMNKHAGKVAEDIKKTYRDNNGILSNEKCEDIKTQLYHMIFIIAEICFMLNINISDVAEENLAKLHKRMEEGKLHGSGDNR